MSEHEFEYKTIIQDSGDPGYTNRILIGTPTTGLVRIEWVGGRYGQVTPCNWSHVTYQEYINSFVPLRYQVDDAQNLIVKEVVEKNFEWLLLYEHDVIPPPDCFIRINQYIIKKEVPIVSGLYYSRSRPSEPLVYRGRGTSYYPDWKMGDLVWADGVPTGLLLIHNSILKEMWKESPEYALKGTTTRRVFETPRKMWYDPQTGVHNAVSGTSDLAFCDRVMQGEYFRKAGWEEYQAMKYPFLVDTNLFCKHVDPDGAMYP